MSRIDTNLYVRMPKDNPNVREYFPDFSQVLCGMAMGPIYTIPTVASSTRMGMDACKLAILVLSLPGVSSISLTRTSFTVTISPVYNWDTIQIQVKTMFELAFDASATLLDFDHHVPKDRRV